MVQITVGFNWPNEGLFFIIFFLQVHLGWVTTSLGRIASGFV